MQTAKLHMNKEPVSLGEWVDTLAKETGSLLPARNMVLHRQADPVVMADRDLITQVFSNRVDNAIKYSPPGSGLL